MTNFERQQWSCHSLKTFVKMKFAKHFHSINYLINGCLLRGESREVFHHNQSIIYLASFILKKGLT